MTETYTRPIKKGEQTSTKIGTSHVKENLQKNKPQKGINKWFYDLPIRKKQLAALVTSEVISIIGLVGVGAILIVTGGRIQLLQQAKSELVVTEINYNIKIDQMGFGFRGQSDNAAIIEATLNQVKGQEINADLEEQVTKILQNEIKAREIEYATLVGKDLKIIVNANNDRSGETFNPNNLVEEVIKKGEQIKTSEIVSKEDLAKESPPLPETFELKDALIRYTVTPVKNPETGEVMGALISGDIVDGKLPIVEKTLEAFEGGYSGVYSYEQEAGVEGGYSGVYSYQRKGEFELATAINKEEEKITELAPLANNRLLEKAVAAEGKVVSERGKVGSTKYTIAAKSILNYKGKPVAILVRGTPETQLNNLLLNNLVLQVGIAVLALIADIYLAFWLGKTIAKPIEKLKQVTQKCSTGEGLVRAEVLGEDEIGKLAESFNELTKKIENNEQQLRKETGRSRLLAEVSGVPTLNTEDLEKVFSKAIEETQKILGADRIIICRFNSDFTKGYVSHESRREGWESILNQNIFNTKIPRELIEIYTQGQILVNLEELEDDFVENYQQLKKELQVKADLMIPILNQGNIYGLLMVHHCLTFHKWEENEINFLRKLAAQLGIGLERVTFIKQQEREAMRARLLKDIALKISSGVNKTEVLEIAVNESRKALETSRVIVYKVDKNWSGEVIAESREKGWSKALGKTINDPYFGEKYIEKYQQGRVEAINNIEQDKLSECYRQLEVKANLIAPILLKGELLGLLVAHQCNKQRNWEEAEKEFFAQIATQLGLGLERIELIETIREDRSQQQQEKEKLQQRALELIMEIDPVSKGDLSIHAHVTPDEIGTLADSYNSIIKNLGKIVTQVQKAALEVTTTTKQNEVSVSHFSSEAQRQSQEIMKAFEQIKTMNQSISDIVSNAEFAEAVVEKASLKVEVGEKAMNRTIDSIVVIRETVAETAKKVKSLGESTQKISKVVNLISNFADQTNLLALNASIEAAHAGEQGRGFAVVADEVRSLARLSAAATVEIEKVVSEIQAETNEVVAAMESGTEQVVLGTKLVGESKESLGEIAVVSKQINELVRAIANAATQQSFTSFEVTKTMSDVADISNETATSATQVSQSFAQLLTVAMELQESVGKFKVK